MQSTDVITVPADGTLFFNRIESYLEAADIERVRDAFDLARREHGDERRKSGELFFTHPLTVAHYLAQYRLDTPALIAALLHDIAEDTRVSVEDVQHQFGEDVSHVVDGVTKLDHIVNAKGDVKQLSPEDQQNATLHKLFESMTGDVRVVLVKLFDRLHNMRTIDSMPHHKQCKKAKETLSVYAPLANKLGMWALKNELQDLSIRVLERPLALHIAQKNEQTFFEQQPLFSAVRRDIATALTEANVEFDSIKLHQPHVYGEYQQFQQRSGDTSDPRLYESDKTLRVVVLLDDVPSCYLSLCYLHKLWRPVKHSFDDYIAAPRDNHYRALHTTVMHSTGQHIKIRFRTKSMDVMSHIGILAQWAYKDTTLWSDELSERVDVLTTTISENINLEPTNLAIGVQSVVEDVFSNQILVFTPKGDARELPQGATPIDFAYAIHTDVGHQCRMAYVNGASQPLNKPLHDGDRVYIVKNRRSRPARTWLDEDLGYVKTSRARSSIRRWFRRLSHTVAVREGREQLQQELDLLGLSDYPHQWIADLYGWASPEPLYHDIGRAELPMAALSTKLLTVHWNQGKQHRIGNVVKSPDGEAFVITQAGNRKLRVCHICKPRPGDVIQGFVRKNGQVTVHRMGCYAIPAELPAGRRLKLGWGSDDSRDVRLMQISIHGYDRAGLMFEVIELIQTEQINMTTVSAAGSGDHALIEIELMVTNPRQLVRVLHRIQALVNVYAVNLKYQGNVKPQPILDPQAAD